MGAHSRLFRPHRVYLAFATAAAVACSTVPTGMLGNPIAMICTSVLPTRTTTTSPDAVTPDVGTVIPNANVWFPYVGNDNCCSV